MQFLLEIIHWQCCFSNPGSVTSVRLCRAGLHTCFWVKASQRPGSEWEDSTHYYFHSRSICHFFSVIFGFQLVVLKQQPFKCILALTCRGQGVWSFNRRGEKKAGESCQKKPVMLWSFLSAVSLAPLWVFTEVAAVAREKHTQKETSGSGSVLRFIQSVFFVVFATVTGLKGYSLLNQVCRPLT